VRGGDTERQQQNGGVVVLVKSLTEESATGGRAVGKRARGGVCV
jgi:hypothetical protein